MHTLNTIKLYAENKNRNSLLCFFLIVFSNMNLNLERKKRWSSQSFHQKEILTKCMLIKTQLGWSSLLTPKAMQFTAASSLTWRIWALVRFEWSPIHPLPYSLPQDFFLKLLHCSSDFFIHIYCVYFISIYHSLKKKN